MLFSHRDFKEVLIFGTGKTVLPLPPSLRSHLNNLGIQVDVQSTHNASSTFNVLVEEGRKVALALLPAERAEVPKTKVRSGTDVFGNFIDRTDIMDRSNYHR